MDSLNAAPSDAVDISATQDRSVLAWVENGSDLFVGASGHISHELAPEFGSAGMFSYFVNPEHIRMY